jgi:4'-phosphopantetheinyl transferase EntD
MIGELLPPCAVAVEGEDGSIPLLPEEERALARMGEKRRREFAAGRRCARRALERLGWRDFPVLIGSGREPVWPPGVVGSITHCTGYSGCAVAWNRELRSVGIDAEQNAPLPAGTVELVCTERERSCLPDLPGVNWPTLIFSAKEALYKAWYPLTRRWLDFHDAEISIDAARRSFLARLLIAPPASLRLPGGCFEGRYLATGAHLLTAVTLRP